MTRRTIFRTIRDALGRRKRYKFDADAPRTRISVAYYSRPREVVHPERDLSEWVDKVMTDDWDSVVKGKNKH